MNSQRSRPSPTCKKKTVKATIQIHSLKSLTSLEAKQSSKHLICRWKNFQTMRCKSKRQTKPICLQLSILQNYSIKALSCWIPLLRISSRLPLTLSKMCCPILLKLKQQQKISSRLPKILSPVRSKISAPTRFKVCSI